MKKIMYVFCLCGLLLPVMALGNNSEQSITPAEDRTAFKQFFEQRFKDVKFEAYIDGIYALDADQREQWEEIEIFPPYEFALDEGKELFETPFANGNTYGDCFANAGIGVRQNYPYFDSASGEVVTLELAINQCRIDNQEPPLKYKKGAIAAISSYMAFTSRGNKLNVVIPEEPEALNAYQAGKAFYYSKRGQLNFSCADCHVSKAGMNVRADKLSAGLGHPTHFPVYRSKWGEMGTLHRRFAGCNQNVRAMPLAPQSESYRNLEYFLSYMSNDLEINGPGARK